MTVHEKFREDMENAGYEVHDYQGRWYWKGPSVHVDHYGFQDVCRLTNVRLQIDSLGLGLVVYPTAVEGEEWYE